MKEALIKMLKIKGVDLTLKVSGLLFKEATTEDDLELVYKIRYKVYRDEGYIEKSKEKIFIDKYDPYSINFIILKKKKPIGTARLILFSKMGFPTEKLFNFKRPDVSRNSIAEISRLAIDRDYRGGSRVVMIGLFKMIYLYVELKGIKNIYFNVPEKLKNYFSKYGLNLHKLEELPPTKLNISERQLIAGYFKQKKLEPYLINIKDIKIALGL